MDQIYNTESIYFRFNDTEKSIYLKDKTDVFNETSAYNTKKRAYKTMRDYMIDAINHGDTSTFYAWINACDTKGLRMHTYCAMD